MQEQFQNLGSAIGNIFGSVSGAKEAITHFLGMVLQILSIMVHN
ncbi:hypothetical protein AAGX49_14020 [Staphylococcus aureus]